MVGTVASKAHGIVTVLSRSTSRSRNGAAHELKTMPTAKAEDDESPLSQPEDLPDAAFETPEPEPAPEQPQLPLLPWEVRGDDGDVMEAPSVKEKILELAVYRRTFVEVAAGEEEYVFAYQAYKEVVRELLYSNPNLREKRTALVETASAFVVSEEQFWRNFFLRCNAIRVAEGLPSYLPEAEPSPLATGAFARFKRGLLIKKQRSSANLGRLRRSLLGGRSTSTDSADPTASEVDLGDLDLDLDGEIEKELVKRRPSRAVEQLQRPGPPSQPKNPAGSPPDSADAPPCQPQDPVDAAPPA
ncbi:hypothetical protein BBJ28_00021046 [Nothophytophthora sp. Chile5]|nr:hypothetical protein BBJ28_00021046 [Nothophytophthora sp. Chile5]